jgi:simple sugar transport system ATP-binding protein
MARGIGMVHQEFMLIPGFTVAENIKLNREPTRPNLASRVFGSKLETVDGAVMRADSRAALDKLAISIDEWALVAGLPVGHMQFVEIAREIDKRNVRLLVFDEPTAVLTETEAEMLLDAMKRLASEGIAILFITHRLDEVMEVADNITILRDGEVVAMNAQG